MNTDIILRAIGVLIFIVTGVVLLINSILFNVNYSKLHLNGITVKGLVIEKEIYKGPDGLSDIYYVKYKDFSGNDYASDYFFNHNELELSEGDTICILYDPNDPKNSLVVNLGKNPYWDRKSIFFGSFAIVFGAFLFVIFFKPHWLRKSN